MSKELMTLKDEFLMRDTALIDSIIQSTDKRDAMRVANQCRLANLCNLVFVLCDHVHALQQELQQRRGDSK